MAVSLSILFLLAVIFFVLFQSLENRKGLPKLDRIDGT
jgi:hypothetical protein